MVLSFYFIIFNLYISDPVLLTYLLYINQTSKFIISELDDTHLFIKKEKFEDVKVKIQEWYATNTFQGDEEDENTHLNAK